MAYVSDAELWVAMSREYPADEIIVTATGPRPEPGVSKQVSREVKPRLCFTCKDRQAGNDYAGPFSAYCAECQPKDTRPQPRGSECWCAGCGEMFTSPSAFDVHQDKKTLVCRPLNVIRRNGDPVFKAYRKRDGFLIWGRYIDASRSRYSSNLTAERCSQVPGEGHGLLTRSDSSSDAVEGV